MPAFTVKHRNKSGGGSTTNGRCQACDRPSTWRVTICGWDAGTLCNGHKKEWVAVWDARGKDPKPARRAA